ncbi:MAG: ribosomal L7Ae/L30e/S12e/Gadd45 family protein [Corallococcus sp.]|nr:ribosomal L7Ae/L30e/S12e/Gadd45 family protein [Corallococcus sp.]
MANKSNSHVVIGLRQVLRELKVGNVVSIVMATDADKDYKRSVLSAAKEQGVAVTQRGTSESIAAEYGIEVKSAVVGFLKQSNN